MVAFCKLNDVLSQTHVLIWLKERKTMFMYLFVSTEVIRVILVEEDEISTKSVYFIGKVFHGQYQKI